MQLVKVVDKLDPTPLTLKIHVLVEAPLPYPGLVLWPYLDFRVGVYPNLGLQL